MRPIGAYAYAPAGMGNEVKRHWGEEGISANLFCQHPQVTFTPYRIVLKNGHRTSNVEWEKMKKQPYALEEKLLWYSVRII